MNIPDIEINEIQQLFTVIKTIDNTVEPMKLIIFNSNTTNLFSTI